MTTPLDTPSALTHASITNELTAFFQRYGEDAVNGQPEAIAASYAPAFIVAGPKGSTAFTNDEKFRLWLGDVRAYNHKHGLHSMMPAQVHGQLLSPTHALAQVIWSARFQNTGDRDITFKIFYLLERAGESWKVLGYVSEEDQEETMARINKSTNQ